MTLGGALLVALVLGVFAYVILDSQAQDREDVEQRFRDVTEVSAAVTNGIFEISLSGTQQQAATRFGAGQVDAADLEAFIERSQLAYGIVIDENGDRLAATSEAPPPSERSEAIKEALATGEPRFSDVIGEDKTAVVQSVVPFPTQFGQRVYVGGTPLSTFAEFLASFLGDVPNFADAESMMVDSQGVVLGGANLSSAVGEMIDDGELLEVVLDGKSGDYGSDRYFASAPVVNSKLRVLLNTSKDDLYDSLSGSRKTVPWILFAAFALAAAAGLYLLRRASLAGAELERRQLNERHAVEINDNIIQGLALAKYQLQAGQDQASATQVSETLREAQRLVSGLLGEAEVQAGQLRREVAAETKRKEPPAGEPKS